MIWKAPQSEQYFIIGEFEKKDNRYYFNYVDPELSEAKKYGFVNFSGFDEKISTTYVSNVLFPNIENRLPNKHCERYLELLNTYDLNVNSTEIDALIKTKGRLVTDNFEFVPVFNEEKIEFEIAATGYCKDLEVAIEYLERNAEILLEKESNNEADNYSVKVIYEDSGNQYHIGYIPRYYSKQITELLDKNIAYSAMIDKIISKSVLTNNKYIIIVKLIFDTRTTK